MITYVSRLWGMLAHQEGCVTGPASRALLSACCIEWNAPPPSGRIEKQPQLFRRMAHFFQLLWTLEDSEFVEFSSRILRAMFSNWNVVMFAWPSRIKSSLDSFLVEITFFPFLTPLLTPSLTFPFSLLWTFPPPLSPILMSCTLHFLLSTSHYSVIWNCDFLLISAWLIIFSCSQCEYTGSIIFFSFCLALVVRNSPANEGDVRDVGLIPESGLSPGGGHGSPLHYSCLKNPMDRGAWWAMAHRVVNWSDSTRRTQWGLPWWSSG